MTLNGIDLWEIIRQRGHPALRQANIRVQMDDDWMQYTAAEVYGWDAYWSQDEDTRALMCWRVQADRIISAIQQWEATHKDP